MEYFKVFLQLLAFIYPNRKDLKRHGMQFYGSEKGLLFNQLGFVISTISLIVATSLLFVLSILEKNMSAIALLKSILFYVACQFCILAIAYLYKDLLSHKIKLY